SVEQPATAKVAESELTFSKGYARRRAVQEAANKAAGTKVAVAHVEAQTQIGRAATAATAAIKPRPRTIARANTQDQRRVADAREERGFFGRFDQPDRYERHQAMAFGDQREPRQNRRQSPHGGLYSNSQGGFFGGGLF